MRWLRILITVAAVAGLLLGSPTSASGDVPSGCKSVVKVGEDRTISIEIDCRESGNDAMSYTSGRRVCTFGGSEVPCKSDQGTWYSPRQCYISRIVPPPDFSYPAWEGRTTGSLYYCRVTGLDVGSPVVIWIDSSTSPPDPEELARRAVNQMQLKPITIGIVPNDDPDSVGLVGMPIWLWVASPSDQTMGPISRSASEGGYTVTATAEVERVRWSMGDGGVKTCTGPGTPYKLRYGITESPTCGYRFEKQGEFTVAARSDWLVRWSGIGETGTFRIYLTQNTQVVIGELNVLTVSEGS